MSELVTYRRMAPTLIDRARALIRGTWIRMPSLSKKSDDWDRYFGVGTDSGIVVTDQNWMTFSAVFAAVNMISADVAKVPLNLLKRRKDGGSDHYIDSKLYHILKNEANPEQSSMVFRQTLLAHALTCHGGYAEIERNVFGQPVALWILTPDRVEPIRRETFDRNGRKTLGPLEYRIDGDANQILPARDVIHIHGMGYDGYQGYGIINKARQAIALALAMEKFGATYFGKGTIFGGHLETEDDLDEDQKAEIKKNIDAFRSAQDSAWRILVTGQGHKFHQFTSKPADSQMDESRTAQVLEVARFFRLPPVKLGVNTPGTVSYASVEMANIDYYVGCLLDWYTLVEQELNRKLIPAPERRQQYIKHNVNAFLRGATEARTALYTAFLDRGVANADEIRELEDWNPQPDGLGKMYLVQGAQVPKHQLEEVIKAKIKKDTTPKPTLAPPASGGGGNDDPAANAVRDFMTSVTQTMTDLGEHVAAMTEQQRNLDAIAADLEAERIAAGRRTSELEAATAMAEQRTSERDAAITRAQTLEEAAASASTDRAAALAAAEEARQAAGGAVQRAETAIVAQQEAETAAAAAQERLDALTASHAELSAESETLRTQVAGLQEQLTTEQQAAATVATERAAAAIAVAESLASVQSDRDQVAVEAQALRTQIRDLEVAHAASLIERDQSIETVRAQLLEAKALLEAPDNERAAKLADLTATTERLAGELTAAEARAAADRVQFEAEVAPVRAALAATELAQGILQIRVGELEAKVADSESSALRAQQLLEGERASRIERMTATIAAHRGLIADVLGRMTRRQAQQARAKQATPEKLRRWLAGVVSVETPICQEALLPAMRVRLAAKGSTEDPVRVTGVLVAEHLSAFEVLMRDVLEAAPEDFHGDLERSLVRWETERPGTVADALLEDEVRNVRAL